MASRIVPAGGWQSRLKPVRTPRVKNRSHLDFIKRLPCICCAVEGSLVMADDPMHIRSGSLEHGKELTGASETSSDRWSLPGCRKHHDEQHSMNEREFWLRFGIDQYLLALVLWGLTGDDYAALTVIRLHAVIARGKKRIRAMEEGNGRQR